jgi:cytochrome c-type biogenesis protein CcmH/NrfG
MDLLEEAFLSVQKVLTRHKFHAPAMFLLGTLHMTGTRHTEAVGVFEKIIDKIPNLHPAPMKLGILAEGLEELKKGN